VIDVPRSSYYYRPKSRPTEIADIALVELIGQIQDEFPGYGYRRVTRELGKRGQVVNHKRVSRVMKIHGLGIKPRRRFVRTTDSNHNLPVFPNLYGNIIPAKPDIVWVADITYSTPNQRSPPGWGRSCLSMFGMQRSPELML